MFPRSRDRRALHVSHLFRCRRELCQISVPSVQLVAVEVVEAQPQEEQHAEKSSWRRPRRRVTVGPTFSRTRLSASYEIVHSLVPRTREYRNKSFK